MSRRDTNELLNRVLTTLFRSLPMYLTNTTPWTHHGDERAVETLRHIVADQQALSARIADYLQAHHAAIDTGDYPMTFTDTHDLSLDFLVSRLIRQQQRDLTSIERCTRALASADPAARCLAEEALGAARGQLDELESLAREVAGHQASTIVLGSSPAESQHGVG